MEIFLTLDEAKANGKRLARLGQAPTIYELETGEYVTVMKGKWPPQNSWPLLKWAGAAQEWIPILTRLDSLPRAQDTCGLFNLLGHTPIIVEFPGITFDVFLREDYVPSGAWIVLENSDDGVVRQIQPPRFYNEEESEEIRLQLKTA